MGERNNGLTTPTELATDRLAMVGQTAGLVAHEQLNPLTGVSIRLERNLERSRRTAQVLDRLVAVVGSLEASSTVMEGDNRCAAVDKDLAVLHKIAVALQRNQRDCDSDLQFLAQHVRHIVRLAESLRQMARGQGSERRAHAEQLVDRVLDDMAEGLRKRHISVKQRLAASVVVSVAESDLYAVMTNLVRNASEALEATAVGGGRELTVSGCTNGDLFEIRVCDNGAGIVRAQWERVFDLGYTTKVDGGGLGLSLSRRIAREYGGALSIEDSTVGQGTRVLLSLPTASGP